MHGCKKWVGIMVLCDLFGIGTRFRLIRTSDKDTEMSYFSFNDSH